MFRAFILPVLLMGMVGGPMLYSHHQRRNANPNLSQPQSPTQQPWQTAGYRYDAANANNVGMPSIPGSGQMSPYVASGPATNFQPGMQRNAVNVGAGNPFIPTSQPMSPSNNSNATAVSSINPMAFTASENEAWNQPGMTPDYGKAETMVFAGDASGPDLTSPPMSFTPTIDLSSLFRFDVTKQSITSRWDRVSTCPADQGLHGMRVAVVTGTNSWDLHGSLTYYFDASHRVQRITYRGWTGDASRLLQTLQQPHQLRPQPTHWAGLYLSKRSGLLMKHPAVIDKSNPVQQLALILEINNPNGKTPLSNDFQSLLPAAMATQ